MHWKAYIQRRGSLNVGRRVEQATANIKYMMGQQLGYAEQDIWNYMPNEDAPDISFDEMREKYEDEDEEED